MTDEQFMQASRAITATLIDTMQATGTTPTDAAAVIGFAMLEAMGQLLGNASAAIERLRNIADIAEAQVLAGNQHIALTRH